MKLRTQDFGTVVSALVLACGLIVPAAWAQPNTAAGAPPAAKPPAVAPAAPGATPSPVPNQAADAAPAKRRSRANEDARHCLSLPTGFKIRKCAEQYL